jgi:uncharacterized protein
MPPSGLTSFLNNRRRLGWVLPFLLAWLAVLPLTAKVDVDSLKATGYLNDYAGVVDPASKPAIEQFCYRVQQTLGVQIAVVTFDTVGYEPMEDFGIRVARHFSPGDPKTNQGIVMILVIKDRKSDIEVGRGTEAYLTDGFSGSVLRAMRPELRAGQYGPAILQGLQSMAAQIAQGKGMEFNGPGPAPVQRRPVQPARRGFPIPLLILLGFFGLIWLLGRGRGGRPGGGGGAGNVLLGMLIGNMLSGGRGGGGGGGWGGGGFGGGNDGGGGFGGFGGGGFGGGGASSDW